MNAVKSSCNDKSEDVNEPANDEPPKVQGNLYNFDLLHGSICASHPKCSVAFNAGPAQDPVHVDGIGGQLVIYSLEISMTSGLLIITLMLWQRP